MRTLFEIRADDGEYPPLRVIIAARGIDEAISLAQIRLEQRDLKIIQGKQIVARVSKFGELSISDKAPADRRFEAWNTLTSYHQEERQARIAASDAQDEASRALCLRRAEDFSSLAWAIIEANRRCRS